MTREVKFKVSENQMRQIGLIYAMLSAARFHKIGIKEVRNLNPKWLAERQDLFDTNVRLRAFPIQTDSKGREFVEFGFFKIRRTEGDRWVVVGNFQWRIKGKILKEAT